jgi:KDEL-tailed cysteine endopeptidase
MPHFNIKESKVIENDCSALSVILKERPVSVVISANPSFIFYRSGILNECGAVINHSLQLVGLMSDSSGSYYIGKNSWGSQWGDQGYIYINSLL